jgi:Spy/CpxP family protein refolding chaperone
VARRSCLNTFNERKKMVMRLLTVKKSRNVCATVTAILGVCALLVWGGPAAFAQTPAPSAPHAMPDAADQNKQLADQITELRAQVARLQAAVQQTGTGKPVTPKPGMNMPPAANQGRGMMEGKGEMGMPAGPGAMPPGAAAMGMKDDQGEMPMPAAAMGMCCMGEKAPAGNNAPMGAGNPPMGGMASMSGPSSAMPGQAGASHLYHIGSNGFFLNHSQHITLTADQKVALNRLKERATLDRASEQRKIDQGEQELYTLTGADQFDSAKVQAKVGEIEKLRADQRMNFIRLVGDATSVLTHEQHLALMGTMAAPKK